MSWKTKLLLAIGSNNQRSIDAAVEEVENEMEKKTGDQPHIEVHNHMPAGLAGDEPAENKEMAERIAAEQAKGKNKAGDDEPPPWFSQHVESTDARFKTMNSAMTELGEGLKKFFAQEAGEPEHDMDPELIGDARDEPAERQEMAERIREKEKSKDELGNEVPNANSTTAILGELEFEAPPGTGDRARRATDSQYLEASFQDTVAKAEVIAPGLSLPAYDGKAPPKKTFNAILGLRRTALDLAYSRPELRGVIDAAMSGRALDTKALAPSSIRTLFNAVAAVQAGDNNRRALDRTPFQSGGGVPIKGTLKSLADLNKRNAERFRVSRKSA